ncbi:MAG: MerR family transcriptional regulator [Ktedonobacteraceae bacterium]|nr:MerR family transcriptional regulator [Ktedonobacteraceae bacterium]
METLISIKELTKQTGLTVRTLRYYDAIGLLRPSSTTPGGHRLYSKQDLARLQQILFLKRMGFHLDTIKQMLERRDWSWQDSLNEQSHTIREQRARLDEMEALTKGLLYSIQVEGEIKWPVIFEILQMEQQDRDYKYYRRFLEEYFEPHERELLKKVPSVSKEDIHTWIEVERRLRSVMHKDPAVQEAVAQFVHAARTIISNDEAFLEKLWQIRRNPELSRRMRFYPVDPELTHFMDQAFAIYDERNNNENRAGLENK